MPGFSNIRDGICKVASRQAAGSQPGVTPPVGPTNPELPELENVWTEGESKLGAVATRNDRLSAPTAAALKIGPLRRLVVPNGPDNPLVGDSVDGQRVKLMALPKTAAHATIAADMASSSAPSTPGVPAVLGPVCSQRRRRSSWAGPGAQPECSEEPAAGLEALSPDDLYRQFVAIRDAVLRKAASAGADALGGGGAKGAAMAAEDIGSWPGPSFEGAPERLPGGERVSPTAIMDVRSPGSCGRGGPADGGFRQSARRRASDATSTSSVHSPHRLSNATFADSRIGGGFDPAAASGIYSPQRMSPAAGSPLGPQHDSPQQRRSPTQYPASPRLASPRQQQLQRFDAAGSPVGIDLHVFYHSPSPSTGGRIGPGPGMGPLSPFQGAVPHGSDCVAYNALYAGGAPRAVATSTGAPPAEPFAAAGTEEAVGCVSTSGGDCTAEMHLPGAAGVIPRADSLFSLPPSFTCTTNEVSLSHHQQQEFQELQTGCCRGGSGGGGALANMLVWQEDMTATVGGDAGGGEFRLSEHGSGVVVHGNHTAESTFSGGGDYQRALQSAAARQLLAPQPEPSVRDIDCTGEATATGGVAISSIVTASAYAQEEQVASPFQSYVPLPLPGLTPPRAQANGPLSPSAGGGNVASSKAPALPSSPSMVAAASETVQKCLDKGIPFATMAVEHFAAVVAAAEAADSPLALHILTTHCVYYPGTGRHAASAGGVAFDVSPGGSSSGASSPVAGCSGGGGSGILGRRPATAATTAAVAAVRKLLESGEPLHVMSPCEYQRIILAAQYGIRQLHDMLVAQPSPADAGAAVVVADTGSATVRQASDAGTPTPKPMAAAAAGGGRMHPLAYPSGSLGRRHHRRGQSIGSEGSFSATVVRFQSGTNATAAEPSAVAPSPGPAVVRAVPATTAQAAPLTPAQQTAARLKALVQAAQHGNAARVAHLVARGADVNATEGAAQQQSTDTEHEPEVSLMCVSFAAAGSHPSSSGAGGVCGRTALHYAAEAGSFAVVQLLLHYGAFVGVRDGTGRTAYDLARRKGHDAVAQLLKDAADRRRDVVRACAAQSRGIGAGSSGPRSRAALVLPGLPIPSLTSLVSPRPAPKEWGTHGAGGGGPAGAGAAAAKEAGGAASEAASAPRISVVGAAAPDAGGHSSQIGSAAEASSSPAMPWVRPAPAESGASGSRGQLRLFGREATAGAVATRVQPAAGIGAAEVPGAEQPGACVTPTSPSAKAGLSPVLSVSSEEAQVRPGGGRQHGGKRGLLARFLCGA